MPRECTVCSHPDVFTINEDMVGVRGHKSNRRIAAQYGLSEQAIRRHREHIPRLLVQARDREQRGKAEDLVERVEKLSGVTGAILKEAREGDYKDNELALRAIARLERQVELEAKILEVIKTQPQVNIVSSPQWIAVRTAILTVAERYEQPDMVGDIVRAIRDAEGGNGHDGS